MRTMKSPSAETSISDLVVDRNKCYLPYMTKTYKYTSDHRIPISVDESTEIFGKVSCLFRARPCLEEYKSNTEAAVSHLIRFPVTLLVALPHKAFVVSDLK